MSIQTVIFTVFIICMPVNIAIGIYGRMLATIMNDHLTTSRQSGFWFVISSAVGAQIGADVVMGTTQYETKPGMASAGYVFGCALAGIFYSQ